MIQKCIKKAVHRFSHKNNQYAANNVSHETRLISLLGISRGAGTTHLSIMIGNYLANGLGKKVAVVECNDHNDYIRMRLMAGVQNDSIKKFFYCGMDFYRLLSTEELSYLLLEDYDVVILDMDYHRVSGSEHYRNEFLRSSCRIVVADLQLWSYSELLYFLKDNKDLTPDSFQCVSVSFDPEEVKELEREFHIRIQQIPLERNPFCISGQSLAWFQNLLHVTRNYFY